jgi:DNA replication and repair protein RecF
VHVARVRVRDFRNLEHVEIEPSPGFNVVVGPNGQGKTNLLESIHVTATLRSFRGLRSKDLIRHGTDEAVIDAEAERAGSRRQLRVTLRPHGRRVELNDKPVRVLEDFFGTVNAVAFCPDDIGILRGGPSDRRLFFDRAVFALFPSYGVESQRYESALRQRNALLRAEHPDRSLVRAWDAQLVDLGSAVIERRRAYLAAIQEPLLRSFAEIFDARLPLRVDHLASGEDNDGIDESATLTGTALRTWYAERLEGSWRRDIGRGHTTFGPHRDDFVVHLSDHAVRGRASQGQQRGIVLALKITEIRLLTERYSSSPVLLLDDVSSELDPDRNRRLFDFLATVDSQVFITTTDADYLRLRSRYQRWDMENGSVRS